MLNLSSTEVSRATNAVYNAALEDGDGEKEASRQASAIASSLERDRKEERRAARRAFIRRNRESFAILGVILVVLCLLGGFSFWMYNVAARGDKDYAGYGPHKVAKHAVAAYHSYYGDDETPAILQVSNQKRSFINGRKVWCTIVHAAGKKAVRIYVWDDVNTLSPIAGGYQVVP